jgi:hypothetical protein
MISSLFQLQVLDLDDTGRKNTVEVAMPTEIGTLTHLEILKWTSNRIRELPSTIGHLTKLLHLDLSHNQLPRIPNELWQLTKLCSLSLTHNQLQSITGIGLLANLCDLQLDYNQLQSVPDEFGLLTNLKALSLSHNGFKEVPSVFASLAKLETLSICENLLEYDAAPLPNANTIPPIYFDLPSYSLMMEHAQSLQMHRADEEDPHYIFFWLSCFTRKCTKTSTPQGNTLPHFLIPFHAPASAIELPQQASSTVL